MYMYIVLYIHTHYVKLRDVFCWTMMVRMGPLRPSFLGPASSREGNRFMVRVGYSASPPAETTTIGWELSRPPERDSACVAKQYIHVIAERLSAKQLIPQSGAKSQLEFVCMYLSRLRMRTCHA